MRAEQQPGGAAGGAAVGADVGLAHRAGDVGEQRHHMDAGAHQLVDRELDRRHVGRHQRDPFAVGHLRQAGRELVAVGGVEPVGDFGDVLVAEVAGRLRDLPVDELEERRLVGGQDEGEAEIGVPARPAALRRRADLGDRPQHPLHRVGVDARPLVEHPIDRGRAHAGTRGDFGDGGRGRHAARRVGWRQFDHIDK